jgi:hypothetical protein
MRTWKKASAGSRLCWARPAERAGAVLGWGLGLGLGLWPGARPGKRLVARTRTASAPGRAPDLGLGMGLAAGTSPGPVLRPGLGPDLGLSLVGGSACPDNETTDARFAFQAGKSSTVRAAQCFGGMADRLLTPQARRPTTRDWGIPRGREAPRGRRLPAHFSTTAPTMLIVPGSSAWRAFRWRLNCDRGAGAGRVRRGRSRASSPGGRIDPGREAGLGRVEPLGRPGRTHRTWPRGRAVDDA